MKYLTSQIGFLIVDLLIVQDGCTREDSRHEDGCGGGGGAIISSREGLEEPQSLHYGGKLWR
jgi:hypothetical protein